MNKPDTSLLRLHIRGLEIDAQSGESGVIDLIVRTDDKQRTVIGRISQNIANALYRIADGLNSRKHDELGLRVIQFMVISNTRNDPLTNFANESIVRRWPRNLANGDANYDIPVVYEGVEGHQQNLRPVANFLLRESGDKCTDNAHKSSPKTFIVLQDKQ